MSDMEKVTKHWSNSWIGNWQIVSEERLQQVPHINCVLRRSFERLKILVNQKLLDYQQPEQTQNKNLWFLYAKDNIGHQSNQGEH